LISAKPLILLPIGSLARVLLLLLQHLYLLVGVLPVPTRSRPPPPEVSMRHSFRLLAFGLAGAVLTAPFMAAHADLITNGGFETGQLSSGGYVYENGTYQNWTYSGNAVLINTGSGSPWITSGQTGSGGNQVAGVQTTGSIAQTFTAGITGSYMVSWLDAGRGYQGGSGAQTYIVSLVDNTTALTVSSLSLNTTSGSNFAAESLTGLLSLKAGDSYTLTFKGQDTADETALIDNVNVGQVPEPATLTLFGAGLAGLGWIRRRKAT
jgi:PEP-CTERM motif